MSVIGFIKDRRISLSIIAGLALAGLAARVIFFPDAFTLIGQLGALVGSFIVIFILWEAMRIINDYLEVRMPYEDGLTKRIAVQMFLCMLVLLVFRIVFFSIVFNVDRIPEVAEKPMIITTIMVDILLITAINAGYFGAHFFNEWKKSILRNERLRRERTQVQFDNLKNQLNPHFLFNSLTSLNSLIFANQELASQFLQQLSKVYRYVLQHKDKETVSLATEINFIKNYIFLVKTRFGNSIIINFNIEPGEEDSGIVPVTLQILIENAIKHNLMSEEQPLIIDIYTEDHFLVVHNNLQRKRIVESSNKIGLENMKTLYSFLSERPLEIPENEEFFTVKIPLLK